MRLGWNRTEQQRGSASDEWQGGCRVAFTIPVDAVSPASQLAGVLECMPRPHLHSDDAAKLHSYFYRNTRGEWDDAGGFCSVRRACEGCLSECMCMCMCECGCGCLYRTLGCGALRESERIPSPRFLNLPSSESPTTSWWVESGCYRATGSRALR